MTKAWEDRVRETIRKDRDIRKLNLQKIATHFESIGYEVLELKQPWRHVAGKLKKDGQILFLKLDSTPDLSEIRTRREKIWLDFVGRHLTGRKPFLLPKTYESGWYQERLFWFTTNWIEPRPLATKKPPDSKSLARWIPGIAAAAHALLATVPPSPGDDLYEEMYRGETWQEKNSDPDEHIFASASLWGEESGLQADDLLKEIKGAANKLRRAVTHGDFVPWHMFGVDRQRFALIDADLGSFRAPRYYDVANFYHSVWVRLHPRFSKAFLKTFLGGFPRHQREKFWDEFRPVLAQRIIGGFWDKKNEHSTDLARNIELLERFRKNDLL